ncbi:substrate-binding and VWA domain-containing protein [Nocardiopsis trehalosi]|uniref:substrate-binding and VWA domain-containing protein n=1 Tax=Nocardiopsis trehalosi TaxID=109329 RepID=UPI00083171A1|nr:substrate-binding and VWA domain-containing protein [Nocardiopsis trehalosi]
MGRHRDRHDDEDGRAARRRSGGRRRRGRGGAIAALAAAVAIVLGLGATGWYLFDTRDGCGGEAIALSVAVSPELAPAMDDIATAFNSAEHTVDGRCVTAEVAAMDSANVTYGITGAGPTMGDTDSDVWIPDSSLWPNLVGEDAGAAGLTDTGTSVATSPLVLAQPADGGAAEEDRPSWEALVPTSAPTGAPTSEVRLVDPIRSSSGMATLALISGAIGDEEEGRPQLVAALQALQQGVTPDKEAAFAALGEDAGSGYLVCSEQAAWRHNADHPDAPARVGYPEGGTYTLDYPYLVRTTDPVETRAAELLREALTRDAAQRTLTDNGFRTADGAADADVLTEEAGFRAEAPAALPTPSTRSVQQLAQAWNQLKLDTRLLTIVDISGSMLEPVPGTEMNRMQVTTAAATEGLDMFPEDSELGLWQFSVRINNDLDYRELLPVRELTADAEGGTHKDAIAAALAGMEPRPDGDTGLYDTYLAAFREMSRSYKSDRINAILMLTDGNNDDPDSIDIDELISTIEQESSVERPIPVFTIAFGPDIDPAPLQRIAEATGGEAYTTEDPTEIGDIFLRAFAQRLDTPEEGDGG